MRRLLEFVTANPIAIALLVAVVILGGLFAMDSLPVGLFPGLDVPVVNIITHYPGAASEDVELLVTRPIEDRMRALVGVRRVASTSIEGVSQVTVQFGWGTRLQDARQLVQSEVSAIQGQLPQGVDPRLENIGTTLQEVAGFVVYGGASPVDLRLAVQYKLASRLMGVEGVSRVEVLGGAEPAFLVEIDPGRLARADLTLSDVKAALVEHNLAVAADFITRGSREYVIRGDSRLQTVDDIGSVPLASAGANSVFLGDVASVRKGRAPRHYEVHGNGVPAVAFIISKQPSASTPRVVHAIERTLSGLKTELPPGATVHKFYDQSDIVLQARNDLFHDLLIGAVLAAAVLYLFVGSLSATLIVTATIPLALLATIALMAPAGQTLNVITLSALTLAVGMVVDDAIVVAESILRHREINAAPRDASLTGAAEIAGPDASGTFTTVAAFAPLLFVGGIAGLFVRPFGFVISVALLVSLVTSLSFVPAIFGVLHTRSRRRALGARVLAWLDGTLQRLLVFGFAHRATIVVVALLTLGLGGLAAFLAPMRVLPPIDEGAILIEYVMPPGTSLTESDRLGDLLEREALAQPDIETVYRRTGSPERGLQIEGVNRGELTMKLAPRSTRKRTLDQITAQLRAAYSQIPGVVFLYHQPTQERMDESLSGLPATFGVTIFGDNMHTLTTLAGEVETLMNKDPALANIINNTKIRSPQIVVRPDPVALARFDLRPEEVFDTVQASRFGAPATTILHQNRAAQVLLKLGPSPTDSLEQLRSLVINSPSGQLVPLERVAEVRLSQVTATLTRLNGRREVTLLAEVNGSIGAAVSRLQEAFSAIALPSGYSIGFTGQYQVMQRTIREFVEAGIAAAVLIYLIMALQFRSWAQPLIIMLTVPIALVGAIVVLAITRIGLDVSVGMGVLTLIGIAVNNAIVLLEYANRREAAGEPVRDALESAASVRLRPILMTAAATIFALTPVALNPAVGSRIFQPFAITVIGGLLSSTAATLVFVPVFRSFFPRGPRAASGPRRVSGVGVSET